MKWLIILLLNLPFYANAQEWVKVVSSEDGDAYFVDIKSLLRIGNIQSYWEKTNYTKPTRYGDLSSLGNHRINCETKEYQSIVVNFYNAIDNQGEKTSTIYPKDQSWKPIKPDTIHSSLMRFVCKR
jgi:hypothetical protein